MFLTTKAESTPADILRETATMIEARNTAARERKISAVVAAGQVWREECERFGATASAARDAFEMFKTEVRRVVT